METASIRGALAAPAFRRLWLATSISELGSNIGRVAFILLVHELARNAGDDPKRDVALVFLLEVLPMLFFGPVAGALVDRVDRRKLLVICDIAAGLLLCIIPYLATLPTRAPLIGIALVFSAIATIFHPARLSAIPDLVPKEHLSAANALASISTSLNMVLGMALAGVMIAVLGKNGCFYLDAGTFGVSVLLIWALVLPRHSDEARTASGLLAEIGAGLRLMMSRPVLVFLSATFCATYALIGAWYPVLPSFVDESLGNDPDRWVPATMGIFGLGGILGAACAPAVSRKIGDGRAALAFLILGPAFVLLYARCTSIEISMVMIAAGGAGVFALQVIDTTIVQAESPPGMRGRIFGLRPPLQALGLLVGCSAVLLGSSVAPRTLMTAAAGGYLTLVVLGICLLPGARLLARRG